EPAIDPLTPQNNHAICNASPRFNWGPVVIDKIELARRVRMWGNYKKRSERDMAAIQSVEVQAMNEFGRPARFIITDARQNHYSLMAEEFRSACNWDAGKTAGAPVLYSSFAK